MDDTQRDCKYGVVTFLDVLGWKGIYNRENEAISKLTGLLKNLERLAKKQRGRISETVSVKSISDTIVIFSPCQKEEISKAIDIHGDLCALAILNSIAAGIPVRGATSYGEFDLKKNIYVGQAVDEAASWYEQSDWIGVHLTPSAEYVLHGHEHSATWYNYAPPIKNKAFSKKWTTPCVNWMLGIPISDWDKHVGDIKKSFRALGPIVPEIAAKFANTLLFVEALKLKLKLEESERESVQAAEEKKLESEA